MLLEYQISNFKSFSGPVNIPIKPITLIFGPNSSGKSSIFQSLLMLKQTFEEGKGEVLVPRGNLVDLGSFKQFIFEQNLNRFFTFKMTLKKPERFFPEPRKGELGSLSPSPDIFCDLERSINFDKIALSKTYAVNKSTKLNPFISKIDLFLGEKSNPILSYYRKARKNDFDAEYDFSHDYWFSYWATFDKEMESIEGENTTVTTKNIDNIIDQYVLYRSLEINLLETYKKIIKSKNPKIEQLKGLKEKEIINILKAWDIFIKGDLAKGEMLTKKFREASKEKDKLEGFEKALAVYTIFNAIENLHCFLQGEESEAFSLHGSRGIEPMIKERFPFLYNGPARDPVYFRDVAEELMQECLSNIIYIGPLRDFPQRYYMGDKLPVGFWRDFWLDEKYRSKQALLEINKEIKKYGLDYEFTPSIIKSETSNIKIVDYIQFVNKKNGVAISLKDLGFGYSQILPIIIQSLLCKEKIFLIEQPELHLHPALQAEIGDLFINTALGKQKNTFLIETHSEHLILRIMRRMRETFEKKLPPGYMPITPEDVAVLYVEHDGTQSHVREMPLNERGELVKAWPGGFFEEGLREVLN